MSATPDASKVPDTSDAAAKQHAAETRLVEATAEPTHTRPPRPQLDPEVVARAQFEVLARQRFLLALIAGLAACTVGAVVWAGIAYATEYEIGWIAIGIGFLVGITVQFSGHAVTPVFGWLGAGLSCLSVVLGKYFAVIALIAVSADVSYLEVMRQFSVADIAGALVESFSPIDLLFYGIAIWQGYKLAFEDVDQAVREHLQAEAG